MRVLRLGLFFRARPGGCLLRLLLLGVDEILDGFGGVGLVRFFVGHGKTEVGDDVPAASPTSRCPNVNFSCWHCCQNNDVVATRTRKHAGISSKPT